MKVRIFSREAMEKLLKEGLPENTAVISFYDPPSKRTPEDYEPVDYSGECDRFFMVGIHDIDISILKNYGFTYETYFPEADDLAKFIKKAKEDGLDIICQCEYGQSRSAGCAAAILEYYNRSGIKVFSNYKYYPNQVIFNKVYDALKSPIEKMLKK